MNFRMVLVTALALGCSGGKDRPAPHGVEGDADTDADTDSDADPVVLLDEGYGHTAAEWGPVWWKWLYSLPLAVHPILVDDADCDISQTEEVFFLVASMGTGAVARTCTIPAGKPIFFPVDAIELDNHGVYYDYDNPPEYLGGMADLWTESALDRGLTIDDQTWDKAALDAYDPPYQQFVLTVPDIDPNFLDQLGFPHWSGELDPAVCDGVWILLDPLPVGPHHIAFHAEYTNFVVDVDYQISVE